MKIWADDRNEQSEARGEVEEETGEVKSEVKSSRLETQALRPAGLKALEALAHPAGPGLGTIAWGTYHSLEALARGPWPGVPGPGALTRGP